MRIVQLINLIGAVSAALILQANAADLGPAMPYGAEQDPVILGTGWYLRGDIGYADNNLPTMNYGAVPFTHEEFSKGWMGGLGAGYQFNKWLRADATIDRSVQNPVQGSLHLVGIGACTPPGAIAGCDVNLRGGKYNSTRVLLNGYIDLANWSGMSPYVGAGIGFSRNELNGMSGDVIDTANGTDYGTLFTYSGSRMNFAWALMAGVAVDIAPHVKLDVGYRFIDVGTGASRRKVGTDPIVIVGHERDNEVRVGVRYTPD
jgi:opacity protein-like surface antigen